MSSATGCTPSTTSALRKRHVNVMSRRPCPALAHACAPLPALQVEADLRAIAGGTPGSAGSGWGSSWGAG